MCLHQHRKYSNVSIHQPIVQLNIQVVYIGTNYKHRQLTAMTRPGLEPTIYRTGQEHANHYTTNVVASNDNRWTDIVMTTFSMYLKMHK
jgi:hypothetical protein